MSIERLRDCVQAFTRLVDETGGSEARMLDEGRAILGRLIEHDDWLPAYAAEVGEKSYRQYLLHCDPLERFSIVSFVWGPNQKTPIHNHTVWGLIGVLRGEETARRFERSADGNLRPMELERLGRGRIDAVSPTLGDIHEVANGLTDRPSISIHVYGANIGAVERSVFDPATGKSRIFVSGYHNPAIPNLWFRAP